MKQQQLQLVSVVAVLCVTLASASPGLTRNPYWGFGAYQNDYQFNANKCKMVNLAYAECIADEYSVIRFYGVDFGADGAGTFHIEAAVPEFTDPIDSIAILFSVDQDPAFLDLQLPSSGSLTTFNEVIATFDPPLQGVHNLSISFEALFNSYRSPICALGHIYFEPQSRPLPLPR